MSGRNRKPLQIVQGNLTKTEIKERQMHEEKMRGSTEDVSAPSYLTAKQKREFDDIASKLIAIEIFSDLDVDALARYIDSKHQYLQLVRDMRKVKPTTTVDTEEGKKITIANDDYPKLLRAKNTLFTECRQAAADLGLTISSRLKLVIPQNEDKPPRTEAEKRFSGRL